MDAISSGMNTVSRDLMRAHDLEVARAIVTSLERERRQSGAGDDGADAVVFDKNMKKGEDGKEIMSRQLELQAAEQWMRTVDTRMSDFLKSRLALEAQ